MMALHLCKNRKPKKLGKAYTTGEAPFPECQKHSGKTPKHSGKASPSATLGEGQPGKRLTGKRPSPSAKSRALGEAFPECHAPHRWRFNAVSRIFFTLPRVQHSGKKFPFFETSSPSATLGEEIHFFRKPLPRVPMRRHSGKHPGLFFKCPSSSAKCLGTRGSPLHFFLI
jgi:hypothetical protein